MRLNRIDSFRLMNWMQENEDAVRKGTDTDLVKQASAALSLPLTYWHIQGTRQALGLDKQTKQAKQAKQAQQVDDLRSEVWRLASAVMTLAEAMETGASGSNTDLRDVWRTAHDVCARTQVPPRVPH